MGIHCVFITASVTFFISGARIIIGQPPGTPAEVAGLGVIYISLIAASFITGLVFNNYKSKDKKYSESYLFRRKLAGNIFHVIKVSFFSFVIMEKNNYS